MLDSEPFHHPSDAQREAQAKNKEKSPQNGCHISGYNESKILYKSMGQDIDKSHQGGVEGKGIQITGMKREFTGRFSLLIFRYDSG